MAFANLPSFFFFFDATGERCVGVVGDLCPPLRLDFGQRLSLFDGVRGRVCYQNSVAVDKNFVVVVDFE